MSLRWRWALSIAAVALLAVAATAAAALYTTQVELRGQIDRDLENRFAVSQREPPRNAPVVPFPGRGFITGGPRGQAGGAVIARSPVELDASIQVSVDGQLLFAGVPPLPARSYDSLGDQPTIETVQVDGVPYRMLSGRVDASAVISGDVVVQIARPMDEVDGALAALLGRLALIGLAFAVTAGAVGFLLARRAVRPIEGLTHLTDSLTDVDSFDQERLPTDAPGEVGALSASFGRMLSSLRQSRSAQRRLVADAGHEFRTPLTALRTNLETLQRRGDDLTPEQRTELIEAAIAETMELSDLSAELTDLAGEGAPDDEPTVSFDLSELAAEVADRFRSRTSARIETLGGPVEVEGRRNQLDRAISNLVDNAVKWTPTDGTITVRIDGRTVTVEDEGPGIPDADLPFVFERFHRSVAARTTPGSGLGLAIVEYIVSAHGGTVFARNRPDGGAEVGFTLP